MVSPILTHKKNISLKPSIKLFKNYYKLNTKEITRFSGIFLIQDNKKQVLTIEDIWDEETKSTSFNFLKSLIVGNIESPYSKELEINPNNNLSSKSNKPTVKILQENPSKESAISIETLNDYSDPSARYSV